MQVVYVENMLGQPLMPTNDHRKVRILLRDKKAVVVNRDPFTIRLTVRTKTFIQNVPSRMITAGESDYIFDEQCSAAHKTLFSEKAESYNTSDKKCCNKTNTDEMKNVIFNSGLFRRFRGLFGKKKE